MSATRKGGRPRYSGRIYWPDVRLLLDLGVPVWRLMAVFDVDRTVMHNAFRRYGWDTSKLNKRGNP